MTVTERDTDLVETALERISVRRPYFGFDELDEVAPGVIGAAVPQAAPGLPEHGGIEAAQAARHMAILGSCAAALARDDDKRHHYLALQAHYLRSAAAPTTPIDEPLRAEAVATWVDKRSARSLVKLSTESGWAHTMLDVTFAVMSPRMFERFNPAPEPAAVDGPDDRGPAGEKPECLPGIVRLDCGHVTPAACEGHFPDFPAAPVALVMGKLCSTAGYALARELGQPVGYRIEEGHVSATKLAAAGERLVLEARYDRPVGDNHLMRGTAFANGETIGEVRVIMSAHAAEL